jgi:hypothetical protein
VPCTTYGDATFLGAPDGRALAAPVSGIACSLSPTRLFDAPAQMESRICAAAATIATPSAISMTGTRL